MMAPPRDIRERMKREKIPVDLHVAIEEGRDEVALDAREQLADLSRAICDVHCDELAELALLEDAGWSK